MLNVPWEITVVEKGTLGQAARMVGVGAKKAKPGVSAAGRMAAPKPVQPSGALPGQKARMGATGSKGYTPTKLPGLGGGDILPTRIPKTQAPKRKSVFDTMKSRPKPVKRSWATREPGDVGPHLSMQHQGFKMLTGGGGSGGKSLIPTRTAPTAPAGKKSSWKAPAAIAGVGVGAAGTTLAVKQKKAKQPVIKGLTATLGKPMKKPGGVLKPVQPPKPAVGPKPATAATGPKPVAQPAGPPATLRPPSMMPPKPAKPGQQPVRPR